jgi:DNA-binding NtrC family response regulator
MTTLSYKPTILIIDDETDICYLLSNILKQKDLDTRFVSSLSEAGKLMEKGSEFSYIFLDNHLPDGLGVEYIKEIRKWCPACKIIMITAHDNLADREKASHEGADYFIGKPFSRDLILKTIDTLAV